MMKKYLLTGIIGLVLVGGAAVFMLNQDKLEVPSGQEKIADTRTKIAAGSVNLLDKIPAQIDQLMYMKVDAGLIQVLEESQGNNPYGTGFAEAMEYVDELAAVQYADESGVYSVLYVVAENEEALEKVQEIGLVVGGNEYEYEKLGKNMWLYGDPSSVTYVQSLPGDTMSTDARWEGLAQELGQNPINMAFVSTPNLVQSPNPMVQQFASQLQYTMAVSQLVPGDIQGKIILQFADGVVSTMDDDFEPLLASVAPSDALFYLEIDNLLGIFGINKQQFVGLAPVIFGQYNESYSSLLSADEYEVLYDVLSDHIALIVGPQESMFGISIHLYMNHPQSFEIMESLAAFWGQIANSTLGSGTIEPLDRTEGFAYGVAGLPLFGSEAVLSLDRVGDISAISILGQPSENQGLQGLTYSDKTVMTFVLDGSALEDKIQGLAPLGGSVGGLEGGTEYIEGQTVRGDVQMLPADGQIRVGFSVVE